MNKLSLYFMFFIISLIATSCGSSGSNTSAQDTGQNQASHHAAEAGSGIRSTEDPPNNTNAPNHIKRK